MCDSSPFIPRNAARVAQIAIVCGRIAFQKTEIFFVFSTFKLSDFWGRLQQDRKYFPQVMSLAIDSWGFYNGAGSNNTLEYNIPETTVDRGVYGDLTYGEADRSSNESTMTYGLISKMTYPTGGATSFEFEANDYYGTVPASEEEALNFYSPCGGFSVYSSTLSFDNQDEADDATFVLKPENTTGCSTMLTTFNLEMNLYEYNGSYTFLEKVSMSVSLGDSATGNLQTIFSGTTLQPGVDYRFELDDQEANSRLKVNIPIDAYMDNIPVGGVRVKQIISSDGMSLADDIVRKYRYRQFSDTSKSSGYLLKKPVHGMRIEYAPTSSYSGIENGHCFTEASVAPLSSFEGNHITYDEISEIHPGNGHIDFLFDLEESYTTPIDPDNLTPSDFPFLDLPARINAGNMISKKIYSESGDSIRSEYMSPKSDDLYEQSGKTIIRCQRIPTTASFQPIGINEYDIRTKPYRLEQIRVRLDGVETNTYYEYDSNGDHLMPIQERTINSNGDTIDTRFTYPFDYTDDVYEEMVARNMISPKIETGKYVNDVQVDGSRKSYAFYAGGDTLLTKSLVADTIKPIYFSKVERFHCSWDSTGARTLDNPGGSMDGWDEVATMVSYWDANGKPFEVDYNYWSDSEYYFWDDDHKAVVKKKFKDFIWQYDYHNGTSLLRTKEDIDDQEVNYYFDALSRLQTISARDSNVVSHFTYHYKSPSDTVNYIKTENILTAVTGSSFTGEKTYQYLDGLGRSIQSVIEEHSPNQKDMVTVTSYDKNGLPFRVYEPFEASNTNGAYVPNIPSGTEYTETSFESSPLNRKHSETPPDWYATSIGYGTNSSPITIAGTAYSANTLKIDSIQDPNGNYSINYSDKIGRKLRLRKINSSGSQTNDTEYIYDDKDRIEKIVPPGASVSSDGLTFRYTYDGRDNVIYKWIPDQGRQDFLFNDRSLPAAYRDANLRSAGKWVHTHFDNFGREVATGFVSQSGVLNVSTNQSFTDSLTRTWYDGDGVSGSGIIYTGKVSRSRERILGTNDWLDATTEYDSHGRIDRTESNHHLRLSDNSADITDFTYDYADNVLKEDRDHKYPGGTILPIINEMTYDHAGRQEDHTISIDGQTEHLSTQTYTVKDELDEKNLGIGTSTVLQSLDYFYFENGFLAGINDNQSISSRALAVDGDWFKMALYYDTKPTGIISGVDNMYNGNISTMVWESGTGDVNAYGFQYDYLDRLTKADLHDDSGIGGAFSFVSKRGSNYSYDSRGNFWFVTRRSGIGTTMDDLDYDYESGSNRLSQIEDDGNSSGFNDGSASHTDTYDYDQNGNMIEDPYKDLFIAYNHLNLPDTIKPGSGSDSLVFLYTAGGSKLRKKLIETGGSTIQDYIGGIEYTNSTIDAIYHAEGRAVKDGSTWDHEYVISDHLGNTRVRFHDDNGNGTISSGELLSTHDYYPFGMEWNAGSYQYTYNGKEIDDELGLEWFHYGARMYDPAVARWRQIDPLADQYAPWSPYSYVMGNPVKYIDPDGMRVSIVGDQEYRNNVFNALISLALSSEAGAELVNEAFSSDRTLVIGNTQSQIENQIDEWNTDERGYSTLAFDLSQATADLDASNGRNGEALGQTVETGLAHELAHFSSSQTGTLLDGNGYRSEVAAEEVYAVEQENRVRKEMGLPERTHYGGINVYGKEAVESSKYPGYYNLRNKSNYAPTGSGASLNTPLNSSEISTPDYNFTPTNKLRNAMKKPLPPKAWIISN